ncbi:MAG: FAD-binding oxidoreductase [Spirochaetota bacterium]
MNILPILPTYSEYLSDESQLAGNAQSISFPADEDELRETYLAMKEERTPLTIQGGRTGIVGGAVPQSGHVINLTGMNRIVRFEQTDEEHGLLTVQPGITLFELEREIRRLKVPKPLFWPPDPTEPTATVGGIVSCGSKGCSSYLYGETVDHVEAVRWLSSDGEYITVQRGEQVRVGTDETELLELLVGSEGIFGPLSEITLRLAVRPQEIWGICFFFEGKQDALQFADDVNHKELTTTGADLALLEYIDRRSIDLVESNKEVMTKISALPDISKKAAAMIYMEIHGWQEEAVEEIAESLLELGSEHRSDPDQAWALSGESEVEKIRDFRHAVPESVNLFIQQAHQKEPGITKIATDMSLSHANLTDVVSSYEQDIRKHNLDACIFGHAGDLHLHVNLLPHSQEQYELGRELVDKWAQETSEGEGCLVSEHGAGKLRRDMFLTFGRHNHIRVLKQFKQEQDPLWLWNQGDVLLQESESSDEGKEE